VTGWDVKLDGSSVRVGGLGGEAELRLVGLEARSSTIDCYFATLEVRGSALERTGVTTEGCAANLSRNSFRGFGAGSHANTLSPIVIENNLVEVDAWTSQLGFLELASPFIEQQTGAVVRFNTMINTASSSPFALIRCSNNAPHVFTSNVVVANATPFNDGTTCAVEHSVFDDVSGAVIGTANITAPAEEIVVDLAGGDYHLAPGSVAIGAADPSQVSTVDYDGAARPMPAGTTADAGAFESP
jgi:hypothetical protein